MNAALTLRDGSTVADPRLDRLVAFDERSRLFPVRATIVATSDEPKPLRSKSWALADTLDQGSEGRCVEFSLCHEMLAAPTKVPTAAIDRILAGKLIYWPAQQRDYWQGGSYPGATPFYEGTSVLHGMQVAHELGFYAAYHWAFGLEDVCLALAYRGPVVLGINWHRNMGRTDARGYISATGPIDGGHAILARAVRIVWLPNSPRLSIRDVDLDRSFVTLRNSWGPRWGVKGGDCYLTLRDLDMLLKANGDACVPTKRRSNKAFAG